jgi:dTDP-3,4-didehydro-2,6-dideoxy-alpha-D-glucose 3-reductase
MGEEMTAPEIRLGLLGCADVAARRVLPAVATTPGIRLHAVASRTAVKAEEMTRRFGGIPVVGYQALLDRDDVDAVYLPLPAGLHTEWILRALRAGKHVLAEKPLTTSAADTSGAVALAQQQGLVLMENYMFLRHTQHDAVRELIAEGAIGELLAFAATFTIPARPRGDIRYRAELGGGALLDTGGYPVRAAQLFLGQALRVRGATLRQDAELGVDTGGAALLADGDGVTAQLTFGLDHAYTSRYSFVGSRGRLMLDHAFTPPATHRPTVRLDRQDHREERTLPADDQYAGSVGAFADAVRERGDPGMDATLRQAELIDEIRLCAAEP